MDRRLGRTLAASLCSVLVLSGCETITEEMPRRTGGNNPVSITPVVVPVPIPTPVTPQPTPTPSTPAPGPGPTPQPSASPSPPTTQGCRLPAGTGSGANCPRENPSFLADVEASLDQLVREEPSIFNLSRTQGCGNCYQVVNTQRYVTRLPQVLTQRGLCAIWDGEEVGVKNTNAFNDQYDIITAQGFIRRQGGSYRATCYPASF
jgi:hypothetical protein